MKKYKGLYVILLIFTLILGFWISGMAYADGAESVEVKILGSVELKDRYSTFSVEDEFFFTLGSMAGDPLPEVVTASSGIFTNNGTKNFEFAPIILTEADLGEGSSRIFTYEVVQRVDPAIPGIVYDTGLKSVSFELCRDPETGDLSISGNTTADIFNNRYDVEPKFVSLSGTKILLGRPIEDGEFQFELFKVNSSINPEIPVEATPLITSNVGNTWSFLLEYGLGDAGKSYHYVVREVRGSLPGVNYDNRVTEAFTVDLFDNRDGTLKSLTSLPDREFINTYTANPEFAIISGGKTFKWGDLNDENFKFRFELYETDVEGELLTGIPLAETTNVGGYWSMALDVSDRDAGSYYFVVRELDDGKKGVEYDHRYSYFKYSIDISQGQVGERQIVVNMPRFRYFLNRYLHASWTPQLDKVLFGRELSKGEFQFELSSGEEVIQVVSNDADGKINFDELDFYAEDIGETFFYTVRELNDGRLDIIYDEEPRNFYITVAETIYGEIYLEIEGDFSSFINFYYPKAIYSPKAFKFLEGGDLRAEEFLFELLDGEGKQIQTARNQADGTVLFNPLVFDPDLNYGKSFVYKVREINEGKKDVVYDDSEYEFTLYIVETDGGEPGVVYEGEEDIAFFNKFLAGAIGEDSLEDSDSKTDDKAKDKTDGKTDDKAKDKSEVKDRPGKKLPGTGEEVPMAFMALSFILASGGVLILRRKS